MIVYFEDFRFFLYNKLTYFNSFSNFISMKFYKMNTIFLKKINNVESTFLR